MAVAGSCYVWPLGVVPYRPFDDHPVKKGILAAMKEIESNTFIRFCKRINEVASVEFTHNLASNNHSLIGYDGNYKINITNDDEFALHEICHALGLIHEHQRTDSQTYIRTLFKTDAELILCDGKVKIEANPKGTVNPDNGDMSIDCFSINLTPYDLSSVMHYPPGLGVAFPENGSYAMELRSDHSVLFGNIERRKLSILDKAGLNKLYQPKIAGGWGIQTPVVGKSGKTESPLFIDTRYGLLHMWKAGSFLLYSLKNAETAQWSPFLFFPDLFVKFLPSVVIFQGNLALLYARTDGRLYMYIRQFDTEPLSPGDALPGNWSHWVAPDGEAIASPSLCVFNDKLVAAWTAADNHIYYAVFDNSKWSSPLMVTVPGAPESEIPKTDFAPSLVVFDNSLFCAFTMKEVNLLCLINFDGKNWVKSRKYYDFKLGGGPALQVFNHPYKHDKDYNSVPALFIAFIPKDKANIAWMYFYHYQSPAETFDGHFYAAVDEDQISAQIDTWFTSVAAPYVFRYEDTLNIGWSNFGLVNMTAQLTQVLFPSSQKLLDS